MINANFGLYYAGQATSAIANGFVPIVFAFAALEVAPSGGLIPLVLLALWLARILLLPFASTFAEKHNKAAVMVGADVARLGAQLLVAIPFALGDARSGYMVASAAIYGAGTAFFVPSSIALMPKLVPRDELQRANALLGMASNVGLVLGPALGATLVVWGGVALALFFDVATLFVSVATLALLRRRIVDEQHTKEHDDGRIRFRDTLRIIPDIPGVFAVMAVYAGVQLGSAAVAVLGPVVAKEHLGGIEAWSSIVTAMAVAALLGSIVATRVRVRRTVPFTLIAFGVLTPLELASIAVPLDLVPIVVTVLATTFVTEIAGIAFDAYVQAAVPERFLARVGALESGLIGVMNPIGIAIAFPLASAIGIPAVLYGIGVLVAVTAAGAALVMALQTVDVALDAEPAAVDLQG
ncbi:MFS transporter [Aldersonia sp. NBC_00410]|uniref:MFS transporter n=1 Tax=Aldersonia sp. NBC_00410 TaxID=2975954 RepID=UPI002254C25A|nr:MFS transporter [Aldersonia sp. NBC_00410]